MWGTGIWGEFLWGTIAAVPVLSPLGMIILVAGLMLVGVVAYRRRSRHWALSLLVGTALVVPLVALAGTISVPNTFSNGTLADANEVNANFSALVVESNDQDGRLDTLEALSTGAGDLENRVIGTGADNFVACSSTSCSSDILMTGADTSAAVCGSQGCVVGGTNRFRSCSGTSCTSEFFSNGVDVTCDVSGCIVASSAGFSFRACLGDSCSGVIANASPWESVCGPTGCVAVSSGSAVFRACSGAVCGSEVAMAGVAASEVDCGLQGCLVQGSSSFRICTGTSCGAAVAF